MPRPLLASAPVAIATSSSLYFSQLAPTSTPLHPCQALEGGLAKAGPAPLEPWGLCVCLVFQDILGTWHTACLYVVGSQ